MLNNLRVRRYKTDKTQEDLARAMGVRTATINSIENGKTVPNLRLAMRLSRYFNVTVNELFAWEPEDELVKPEDDNPGIS